MLAKSATGSDPGKKGKIVEATSLHNKENWFL
jgi:hypothetical protein